MRLVLLALAGLMTLAACAPEGPTIEEGTPSTLSAEQAGALEGLDGLAEMEAAGMTPDEIDEAFRRLADLEAGGMSADEIAQALAGLEGSDADAIDGAPTVAVYGDSSALMTALGLGSWAVENPDQMVTRGGWAELGCGALPVVVRTFRGGTAPAPPECADWTTQWGLAAQDSSADIAVVQFGPWEVVDQQWPGQPSPAAIGDAALDAMIRTQLLVGIDAVADQGALVVLLTSPSITVAGFDGAFPDPPFPESDPARMERFNEILLEVAGERPDQVRVVDLAGYLAGSPDDARWRPDGVHFTWETATEVADWLAPEILAAAGR